MQGCKNTIVIRKGVVHELFLLKPPGTPKLPLFFATLGKWREFLSLYNIYVTLVISGYFVKFGGLAA